MGEKVSEAPEPVPRGCSGRGAWTSALAAAAVSSPGASSAESSSGSETLSEEGEPSGFSRQQPPPPGGALGTRPPTAWAPARVVLELGISESPPPPGGAAPPAPRGSSASQEEQDEEVGAAFPHLGPSGIRLPGYPSSPPCTRAVGRAHWDMKRGRDPKCSVPSRRNDRSLPVGHSLWLLPLCGVWVCVCLHMLPDSVLLKCQSSKFLTVCICYGGSVNGCDLDAWLVLTTKISFSEWLLLLIEALGSRRSVVRGRDSVLGVGTGVSCPRGVAVARFQWRQPRGIACWWFWLVPAAILPERRTPSSPSAALKCVSAAPIQTRFRVYRCALVAKLNSTHLFQGTVSTLVSWMDGSKTCRSHPDTLSM